MKKTFLILLACLSLNSIANTTFTITIQPNQPLPIQVSCGTSNVYWTTNNEGGSQNVCIDISCSNGFQCSICHIVSLISLPVGDNLTTFNIDVKLLQGINITPNELERYKKFQENGTYNIDRDIINKDANGNTIIIKAGKYEIINSKLITMVNKR